MNFFFPNNKLAFIELKHIFITTTIFLNFDFKCNIQIAKNTANNTINENLSYFTLNDLNQ